MDQPKSNADTLQPTEKTPAEDEPKEIGGRPATEPKPDKYGDWSKGGRCIDF